MRIDNTEMAIGGMASGIWENEHKDTTALLKEANKDTIDNIKRKHKNVHKMYCIGGAKSSSFQFSV